jgi:hypothetical protein
MCHLWFDQIGTVVETEGELKKSSRFGEVDSLYR